MVGYWGVGVCWGQRDDGCVCNEHWCSGPRSVPHGTVCEEERSNSRGGKNGQEATDHRMEGFLRWAGGAAEWAAVVVQACCACERSERTSSTRVRMASWLARHTLTRLEMIECSARTLAAGGEGGGGGTKGTPWKGGLDGALGRVEEGTCGSGPVNWRSKGSC